MERKETRHDHLNDSDHRILGISFACMGCFLMFVCGLLWSLESWQRPAFTRVADDPTLLGASVVMVLILGLSPWRKQSMSRLMRRLVVTTCAAILLLGGMRLGCERATLANLGSKLNKELNSLDGLRSFDEKIPLIRILHDKLKDMGIGPPKWLSDHVRGLPYGFEAPVAHHIGRSRPHVRRAMAHRMIRDERSASYMIKHWKEFFPAFTGPDVTLEFRKEWLDRLDLIRRDKGLATSSRQAAVLMMALIVLTDPPEFDAWRIPVRESMLRWNEPLSIHGDGIWMRSLDTLLAMDPPETWVGLTRPLVSHPTSLVHAMRVPLRGLIGNISEVQNTFHQCESFEEQVTLWLAVGRSLQEWPECMDESTRESIRTLQRDILFQWLMEFGDVSSNGRSNERSILIDKLPPWEPQLELNPDQQEQLFQIATSWVNKAIAADDLHSSKRWTSLEFIRLLHTYLNESQRENIGQTLIPLLLDPDPFAKPLTCHGIRFQAEWANWLWVIHPLMSDEEQRLFQTKMQALTKGKWLHPSTCSTILGIDAWSKHPIFSREEWLFMAWTMGTSWKSVTQDALRPPWIAERPRQIAVPETSMDTVARLGGILAEAYRTGSLTDFRAVLCNRLGKDDNETKRTPYFMGRSFEKMSAWRLVADAPADEVKHELAHECMRYGLVPTISSSAQTVKERAHTEKTVSNWIYRAPGQPLMLWIDALKNPKKVVRDAMSNMGKNNEDNILSTMIEVIGDLDTDQNLVRMVWDELRLHSHADEHRAAIFGALFRLSCHVPHGERMAMRRDYLNANLGWHPCTDDSCWGWYNGLNPLSHAGGGIGIPWEEDELSARMSWMTHIERQFYIYPEIRTASYRNETFAYLAHGTRWDQENGTTPLLPLAGLSSPLPPTPWQYARQIHLKRPDLHFFR